MGGGGTVGRLLVLLACGVGCFCVAVLAAVVSRAAWRPHGALLPWGLVLAIAASVSAVLLARTVDRTAGWVAAAGWLLGLVMVLRGQPEGDYVLAADGLGETFLVAAPLAVLLTAGWGSRPSSAQPG